MSDLSRALHLARAELACSRCFNVGSVMQKLGLDECPECHGYGKHKATIALLEQLAARVDQLERIIQP